MTNQPNKPAFHSGFVTIVGRPNVGKSTLMNAMIGEKIAIVSPRPQTTRNRLMGILTSDDSQIVFLDTPGIHQPRTQLGDYMMKAVKDALDGMDALVVLVDASNVTERDLKIADEMAAQHGPKLLVLNKIDLKPREALLAEMARFNGKGFDAIIPVSAKTGDGLEELKCELIRVLPEGPKYFPDDAITDQPERLLCAELIREQALRHLRDEVPHGIGVEMMRIQDAREGLTEIDATLYCEKDTHKGIIIGRGGAMLREIGTDARREIERLLGTHVNLKLWVKVRPDWRNRKEDLKNLGYD